MTNSTNNSTTPSTTDLRDGGLIETIVLNGAVALVVYFLYIILRPHFPHIYWPRWHNDSENKRTFYLGYIFKTIGLDDKSIDEEVGMYGALYLEIQRMIFLFFLIPGGICFAIFLTIHIVSNPGVGGFIETTGSNIPNKSNLLWAHVAVGIVLSIVAYALIFHIFRIYFIVKNRFRNQANDIGPGDHTVFINEGLTKKFFEEGEVKKYIDGFEAGKIVSVHVGIEADKILKLINEKRELERQLDSYKDRAESLGTREMVKSGWKGLFGNKVDAIEFTQGKIDKINGMIEQEQAKIFPKKVPSGRGFVTFNEPRGAAHLVYSSRNKNNKLQFEPCIGDVPEIFWENHSTGKFGRIIRSIFAYALIISVSFWWSLPIVFLSNLTNLTTFPVIGPVFQPVLNDIPNVILDFIQAYIPVVLIIVFYALLPTIVTFIANIAKPYSYDQQEQIVTFMMWLFAIFNVLIFQTVIGAGLPFASGLINGTLNITQALETVNFPGVGAFFIRYFITLFIQALALERLNIGGVVVATVKKRFLAKTEKEKKAIDRVPPFRYSIALATMSMWFATALTFTIVVPVIVPAFLCFLLLRFYNNKEFFAAIYPHDQDHDGRSIPAFLLTMVLGVGAFQGFMVAFFLTKAMYIGTLIYLGMLFVTGVVFLLFWFLYRFYFYPNDLKLAVDSAPADSKVPSDELETAYQHPAYRAPTARAPLTIEEAFDDEV